MKIDELYKVYLSCSSVCTDTRIINGGELFFALKGPNFDANKLAKEALEKGAKYAVVDEKEYEAKNCVLVDDALSTLQELARFHRKQLSIPIIGITGSNGKTTNKELINTVLSTQYKTFATQGNYNNHIGVPLSILSISKEIEIGIIEMGANHIGEIEFLCNISDPDIGVITNIGKAHIEGFGGVEGIIKGKTELYKHLIKNNGITFYNADDKILSKQAKSKQTFTFGTKTKSDINGKLISNDPYLFFEWQKEGINLQKVKTNLFGAYNLNNALAAVCIGNYFNISVENINKAITNYRPNNNRSQIIKTKRNTLIMDCYNANPTSMLAAIESFCTPKDEKKLLVIGDMFELGNSEAEEHRNIIKLIEKWDVQAIVLGKRFYQQKEIPSSERIEFFEDKTSLTKFLKNHPIENREILIKASRGMALEGLKEYL